MNTISEIRLSNAKRLASNCDNLAEFARIIDREPTQVSRFMGANPTKNIGDRIARHIEESCKKPKGWLDTVHETEPAALKPGDQFLLATGVAKIEWNEITNSAARKTAPRINCPIPHSSDTFAVDFNSDNMTSMHGACYPKGSTLFVDPNKRAAAKTGSCVLASFKNEDNTQFIVFKELREEDGLRYLRTLNTAAQIPHITQEFDIIGVVIGAWISDPQAN